MGDPNTTTADAGEYDLAGNLRIQNNIIDIGAYEIFKQIDNFPGYALEFDGINDHISGFGIDTALSAITIEAWIYHNNLNPTIERYFTVNPEVAVIRFNGSQYGGYHELQFYIKKSNGSLYSISSDSILTSSEWLHIAGTYDGTDMRLYLNGKLIRSASPAGGLFAPDGDFSFSHSTETMSGKMDEARLWNIARDSIQIRENMHLTLTGNEPGLTGYWQFNKEAGDIAYDYVGEHNGKLLNMDTTNCWVSSTIPIGSGISSTRAEAQEIVDFTGTDLRMYYNSQNNASITVTRIDTIPNINPIDPDTVFDVQYWVVNRFGTGTFDADLTFVVNEDLTVEDENNPSQIKLYTRGSTADTNWVYFADAISVDAANNQATFEGLTAFSQFIIVREDHYIELDITAFLEGPFNGTEMDTYLNPDELPLSQPYNVQPWNYQGTEAVTSIPNSQVVDWILVELRDTTEAILATNSTIVAQMASFLLDDGSVVGLDGVNTLELFINPDDSLFVVLWHRNHLGIISAFGLEETAGAYNYNFSTGEHQVLDGGNAHKEISPGIWGMIAGDGNSDSEINNGDKIDVWAVEAGSNGYLRGDFNMDSHVNNNDKNDLWVPNTGHSSHVPD
ncbi:MAG: LamG domain-containing protein [Bacteroidales bacterium]|nr:LamG domain-containing protein [Bacteroidales bacterium]